jgi:Tol biopolymer transport system component
MLDWQYGEGWTYAPGQRSGFSVYDRSTGTYLSPALLMTPAETDIGIVTTVVLEQGSFRPHLRGSASGSYSVSIDMTGRVVLYRSEQVISVSNTTIDPDQRYRIQLSSIGARILAIVNGVQVFDHIDVNPLPGGLIALSGAPFSSFIVEDFALYSTTPELYSTASSVAGRAIENSFNTSAETSRIVARSALIGANGSAAFVLSISDGTTYRNKLATTSATTGLQLLDLGNDAYMPLSPSMSPNGLKIAFILDTGDANNPLHRQLHVYDLVHGTYERVGNDTAFDSSPTWSPDGQRLVFLSAQTCCLQDILSLNVATGAITELRRDMFELSDVSYTPDGVSVLLSGGRVQLRQIPANGALRVQGIPHPTSQNQIYLGGRYSPDGRQVAFIVETNFFLFPVSRGIHIFDVYQGTSQYVVDTTGSFPRNLSWSPDGTTITFESGSRVYASQVGQTSNPTLVSLSGLNEREMSPSYKTQFFPRPNCSNLEPGSFGFSFTTSLNYDLYVVEDGQCIRLTADPENANWNVDFVPSTGDIYFGSVATTDLVLTNQTDIYVFDSQTEQTLPFITGPGVQTNPDVSDDGNYMVYDDNTALRIRSMLTGETRLLTDQVGSNPTLLPGNRYAAYRTSLGDYYLTDSLCDPTHPLCIDLPLINTSGNIINLELSPDNRFLVGLEMNFAQGGNPGLDRVLVWQLAMSPGTPSAFNMRVIAQAEVITDVAWASDNRSFAITIPTQTSDGTETRRVECTTTFSNCVPIENAPVITWSAGEVFSYFTEADTVEMTVIAPTQNAQATFDVAIYLATWQAQATATAQVTATPRPTNVPLPTPTATLAPLQQQIDCPGTPFTILQRHSFSPGGGVRESHHGIPDAWFHATADSPEAGFVELLQAATGLEFAYTTRGAPTIFMPRDPNHLATRRAFAGFRANNSSWKSATSWNEIVDEMYRQLGSDFGDVPSACRDLYEQQLREYLKFLLCQLSREAILNVLGNIVANSPAAVLQEMILWTYQSRTIEQIFDNANDKYDDFCRAILDRGW